jgi:hypothetical protein
MGFSQGLDLNNRHQNVIKVTARVTAKVTARTKLVTPTSTSIYFQTQCGYVIMNNNGLIMDK